MSPLPTPPTANTTPPLARVLGERIREPERAQEVHRDIVERYPETRASRLARV